ncbi:hypothetical protein LTR85_007557 [Meristemomyces frigidus]|nr:hypothetical protein LTR85_007557 [Meristemomyces frigidus]
MAATRSNSTTTTAKSGRSGKVTKPVAASSRRHSSTKAPVAAKPACTPKAPSRKRKLEAPTAPDDDLRFLGDAQRQLRGLKVPRKSSRRHEADQILGYLDGMEAPAGERIRRQYTGAGQPPADAYHLSPADARRLLGSNAHIDAPVFVSGGANTANILEIDDARRPVEQILDWLVDPDEKHDVYEAHGTSQVTTGEIRDRFLRYNGFVDGSQP